MNVRTIAVGSNGHGGDCDYSGDFLGAGNHYFFTGCWFHRGLLCDDLLSYPNVFYAFLYMYALSRSFEKLKGGKEGREGSRNRLDCPPLKPDVTSLYS